MSSPIAVAVREERGVDRIHRTVLMDGRPRFSFEIVGRVLPPRAELLDFAAIATVFHAMREARPLHIEGAVTAKLLRNLEEFQEAWGMWQPALYKPVRITADEERAVPAEPEKRVGVFAFSGGVDSVAALLRHYSGELDRRAVTPVAGVLVHGFDVPLNATEAFEIARENAEASLAEVGLPLCVVRTDWREAMVKRWQMEFGSGLFACLHNFTGLANYGVMGSDEDYAHLEVPWGSNPVTNPMLCGGAFTLQAECAAMTRTERVALIARYPKLASRLRVCWQGPMSGSNCGKCEKCLRTQLNFLALGVEPTAFDNRITTSQVLGLVTSNPIQLAFLEEIVLRARERGIKAGWLSALEVSIAKNKALLPFRSSLTALAMGARKAVKRAISADAVPKAAAGLTHKS